MGRAVDAVVVGAGCIGVSIGYHLKRRNIGRVVVLEKSAVASGTTGRSSAIIRTHYTVEPLARLALESLRIFRSFSDHFGEDPGFRPYGYVVLASEADREALQANVAMHRRLGIEVQLLSPDEVAAMVPGMDVTDIALAAYEPQSGAADPHLTTWAIARRALDLGVEVLQNAEVVELRRLGSRITEVVYPQGSLSPGIVVLAPGPWAARVGRLAGVEIPVRPIREQIGIFRRPSGFEANHPIISDLVQLAYFRPEIGELTLVGNSDHRVLPPDSDPDSFQDEAELDFLVSAARKLSRRLPYMEQAGLLGGYAGLYEVSPDFNPIIDRVPGLDNAYMAVGFSGHGFKLAPVIGALVADMVTGSMPIVDVNVFRLSRFAEGQPLRGRFAYQHAGSLR